MKRTKPAKPKKWGVRIKLANNLIRPNPFFISRKKQIEKDFEYRRKYGESVIIVFGKLFEEDRGTLLILLQLSKQNKNRPFDFTLSDIAKARGVSNPYEESVLSPIRESIDRLLDAQLRIRPTRKKGLTAKFVLIEGWLDSDDRGNISISPYLEIVRDLALRGTGVYLSLYFSIKSQIARSLYVYLASQRKFYEGEGYEIRLSKLVNYLNYDVRERPWWEIWPHIENAIKELQKINFIGKYKRDTTRYKPEGGVIAFWPAKKEPKQIEGEQATTDTEIDEYVRPEFEKAFPKKDWAEFAPTILKLKRWFDSKQQRPDNARLDEDDYLYGVWNIIPDGEGIIERYIRWLGKQGWITTVHPNHFKPDGMNFQNYLKEYQEKDIGLDVFDGSSLH